MQNCLLLRLRECQNCISSLSNVRLQTPDSNNTVPNSFGTSSKCYLLSPFSDKLACLAAQGGRGEEEGRERLQQRPTFWIFAAVDAHEWINSDKTES